MTLLAQSTPAAAAPIDALRQLGFCFLPRAQTLIELGGLDAVDGWGSFAAGWEAMGVDEFMADGGRYRRRRHALFHASSQHWQRLPDAPHFQTLRYNRLNGGIERWFQPVLASTIETPAFGALFGFAQRLFSALAPQVEQWQVEAHQFRIEAAAGQLGQPTPEGIHRDGVDYVLVALIDRHNIRSGTTTAHSADGTELGAFTLTDPLDIALLDDHRVWHGVTAVQPLDPAQPAWRDVLVLTFRALSDRVAG
jgi:hypothetical protein